MVQPSPQGQQGQQGMNRDDDDEFVDCTQPDETTQDGDF